MNAFDDPMQRLLTAVIKFCFTIIRLICVKLIRVRKVNAYLVP